MRVLKDKCVLGAMISCVLGACVLKLGCCGYGGTELCVG